MRASDLLLGFHIGQDFYNAGRKGSSGSGLPHQRRQKAATGGELEQKRLQTLSLMTEALFHRDEGKSRQVA
jgi:hypothetical protein